MSKTGCLRRLRVSTAKSFNGQRPRRHDDDESQHHDSFLSPRAAPSIVMQIALATCVCAALTLAFFIGGAVLVVLNTQTHAEVSSKDRGGMFQFLGQVCNITSVSHQAISKRETRGGADGDEHDELWDFCEDTIAYTFSAPDRRGGGRQGYTSSASVSQRNGKHMMGIHFSGNLSSDRCAVGMPYQGDFICRGKCPIGQPVACWRPTDSFKAAENKWARCGNPDCIKLVDPKKEQPSAMDGAAAMPTAGYVLIGLGVLTLFCTVGEARASVGHRRGGGGTRGAS